MKKKMTAKEFKEIIKRCGLDNSYESCLCMIANHYYDESKKAKQKGYGHTAEWYREIFDIIDDELKEREYLETLL